MEHTSCPMCNAHQCKMLFEGTDLLHDGDQHFRLVTCIQCGHIYQNPRPTVATIDQYYPANYLPFQKDIADEQHWWRRLDRRYGVLRRTKMVHRSAGQVGRLLDVGCATGIFLDGMRQLGWEVEGIEPSETAALYASNHFGLKVFNGLLQDASFGTDTFDVVTLWDVLEHVHEPREILEEVNRILRPNGLLILSLPNPDSLEARLLGRHWIGWDLPRHLNLFRPQMFQHHLAKIGFQIQQIRSFTAGYSVLVMSLEQALRARGRSTKWIGTLLHSWPLRLLALPYYNGPASWFNLSSIMVVVARKSTEE